MRLLSKLAAPALLAAVALTQPGCIKSMILNGTIEGTRQASSAFDTIGDYELAKTAAQAGLVQFEGMHRLSPNNEDALFLLTKAWGGYAFGFCEDEMEVAEDAGDDDLADYHRKRAKMAYDRAVFYGLELLRHEDEGFDQAKRNHGTMKKWLEDHFDDKGDAEKLFWVAYAWMSRVNLMSADIDVGPELVADLDTGVSMMERVYALDPSYNHYSSMVALAAYHARMPGPEVAQSKELFEKALQLTEKKALVVQLNYAAKYACLTQNKALYEAELNEILSATDPDPQQRLTNAIAKRRARRWLSAKHEKSCGF